MLGFLIIRGKKEWFSFFLQEAAALMLPMAGVSCQNGIFAAAALGKTQQIPLKQTNTHTNNGFMCVQQHVSGLEEVWERLYSSCCTCCRLYLAVAARRGLILAGSLKAACNRVIFINDCACSSAFVQSLFILGLRH